MGLRFTDAQQPHYPPVSSFRTMRPHYRREEDTWIQYLPRYEYEADVEYHPRARMAPAPRRVEPWRIGIVQNVLYERVEIEYFDSDPYATTWRAPALDFGNEGYRPFFNEPYPVVASIAVAEVGEGHLIEDQVQVVAVHELYYGPRGLGWLLNPWDADGYNTIPSRPEHPGTQVVRLRMEDQPRIPIRNWYGGELIRAEQVLVLRFWVVAMGNRGRPIVLALSPPFTLIAWMQIEPRGYLRGTQQRPTWGSYSMVGMHTRIIRNPARVEQLQSQQDPLRPVPGTSPAPLLTGTSANQRLRSWMSAEGLLPADRTPQP